MKKKHLTSLIMLGTATLGMAGLVVASQKDGSLLMAADTEKTFTIDHTTQIPSGSINSDGTYVNVDYNQPITKYTNSGMHITGYYLDGYNTVATTNSSTSYLILTTPSANAYESIVQMDFYANGITSVDYSVSASTGATGANFYVSIFYTDGTDEMSLAEVDNTTSGTLTTAETGANFVRVYFYGYALAKITSLTLHYNCTVA
jgi:hypothetical protein